MVSQQERELYDDFRLNCAEILFDTGYLVICVGCIGSLQLVTHLVFPHFSVGPILFNTDDLFLVGHGFAFIRWVRVSAEKAFRRRVRVPKS